MSKYKMITYVRWRQSQPGQLNSYDMVPFILVCALVSVVLAEPPVNRQYLPPSRLSQQYGVPSRSSGFGSRVGLSTQYGTPSRSNSGISNQYGAPELSRDYNDGLSAKYGPPSASDQFSSISSQYGAPSTSNNLGFRSGFSTQYGAPSTSNSFRSGLSTEYGAPDGGYGYGRGGEQEDPLAEPANYEFNYSVQDDMSGSEFGHEERRQDENAQGQYRVLLPDGRLQIVDYEADQEGFKPRIRYEETGQGGYGRGPSNGKSDGPY